MVSFLESCKNFCQPAQDKLEKWVPGVPSDIVWCLAKSSVYSFTACVLGTGGSVITGIQSVVMTALLLTIYTFAKVVFEKIRGKLSTGPVSTGEIKNTRNIELLVVSLATVFLLSSKSKIPVCTQESLWVAGVPLALSSGEYTPLTGVVLCR